MKAPLQALKVAEMASLGIALPTTSTSYGSLITSIASRRALRGHPTIGSKAAEVSFPNYDLHKLETRVRRQIRWERRNKVLDQSQVAVLVQKHLDAHSRYVAEQLVPRAHNNGRLPPVVYESQVIAIRKANAAAREEAYNSSILLLLSQPNHEGVMPALELCQQQQAEGTEPNTKVMTALLHAAVNLPSSTEIDVGPLISLVLQSHPSQSIDMQAFSLVGQLMIKRCGASPEQIELLVADCMVAEGWQSEMEWPLSVWDLLMCARRQQGDLLGALGVFKRYRTVLDAQPVRPTNFKATTALTLPYMTLLSLYLDIRNSSSTRHLPAPLRTTFPNLPQIITEDLKSRIANPPVAYLNLLFSAQRQAGEVESAWKLWELISVDGVDAFAWTNLFKLYRLRHHRDGQVARPALQELAHRFLAQQSPGSKSLQAVNALFAAALDQSLNSLESPENLELVSLMLSKLGKPPTRHLIGSATLDMILAALIRLVKRNPSLRSAVYGDAVPLGQSQRSRWSKQDSSGVTGEEWRLMTNALELPASSLPLSRPRASVHQLFPAPDLKGLASLTHVETYPLDQRQAQGSRDVIEPLEAMLQRVLASLRMALVLSR